MTIEKVAVHVRQFPEALDVMRGRIFLHEIESLMEIDRPRIVLDFCKVRQMDRPAIHVLLCCLEEAMKRSGDVRLAAVPRESETILEKAGALGLFQVFHTVEEAAESFH
jgi:anti-sigma B factor antagonist